jgi:putative membrane protein
MSTLYTLPAFIASFALALSYTALFLLAYTQITPHREWTLIKQGNAPAALSLGGALIGFCLPLGSVIAHSVSLGDMAVWAGVALLAQIGVFFVLYLVVPKICEQIAAGQWSAAITAALAAVSVGVLNAACMTY